MLENCDNNIGYEKFHQKLEVFENEQNSVQNRRELLSLTSLMELSVDFWNDKLHNGLVRVMENLRWNSPALLTIHLNCFLSGTENSEVILNKDFLKNWVKIKQILNAENIIPYHKWNC